MGGVLSFPTSHQPPYRVVWAGPALAARDQLPPDRREELLEAVERLSRNPRPRQASPAEERGARRWTVQLLPGLQAEYSVADERRFMMLFRLTRTG